MKQKFLSILIICSLFVGTIFANAVSIEFEELESISEDLQNDSNEIIIENEEIKNTPKAIEKIINNYETNTNANSTINENNNWNFSYTGNVQEFITPINGYYRLECYGGGTNYSMGGYAEGTIYLEKNEKLYIYVGGQTKTYNGGSCAVNVNMPCSNLVSGTTSSGATDIRLISASNNSWFLINHSSWNTDVSLLSRIVTAGGGASVGSNFSCAYYNDNYYFFYPYNYSFSNGNLGIGTAGTSNAVNREPGDKGGHRAIARGSGGGGWHGGKTEGNIAYAGTSYVQETYIKDKKTYTITNINTKEAQNNGNGKAKITLLSAPYSVKHYKMDLNGNYVLDEIIIDTAIIGDKITPTVKEYIGFKTPEPITEIVLNDGSTEVSYYYERNQYPVTYIDKDSNGNEIGRTTKMVYYDADVRGSELGDDTSDNKYYSQYQYISDTTAKVTTNGATVYRIFEFCKTEAKSNLQWNDNNDADGFRPEKYKLKLKQNGKIIDEIELPSDTTNYTFPNLPKYDENGTPYQYTFDVDASERYNIRFDDNGNLIVEDYLPANFSVIIPKQIVLDGNTGKADYQIIVNGVFYYNDTLTVQPENNLELTDRSNLQTLDANIFLNKTTFTKKDNVLEGSNSLGSIQTEKIIFPGSWSGSFNFDIKFVMQD